MKKPELDSSSSSLSTVSKQPAWPWSYYCNHRPRTLSFRNPSHILETINSAYIINTTSAAPSSCSSPPLPPVSPAIKDISLESVIRSARSDRLFFDPGANSSSILDEASSSCPRLPQPPALGQPIDDDDVEETVVPVSLPYSDSVFLSMDSHDPLLDFRDSMAEMVMAHSIKDWDGLVELLWWYLKVNDEANHSYIYGAFIDLSFSQAIFSINFVEPNSLSSSCECSTETLLASPLCVRHCSPSTPLSFETSSASASSSSSLLMRCVSGLEIEDYEKEQCSITLSNAS